MKMPKRLIAGLGVLMLSATPLLASADPRTDARIEANYLSDPEGFDLKMMVECAKLSRELFAQPAFDAYRGAPIHPARNDLSDAELVAFIRAKAETVYHPVGTCRIGDDEDAVVDPQLRVRGIEGLRVIDASVMPSLIGGNTNAPTIMIAERASDLIRGIPPLASGQLHVTSKAPALVFAD